MGEHDWCERLHVVGQHVVASLQRGHRLRGAEEHQAGPRARAELDALVVPGRLADRHHVTAHRLARVDRRRSALRRAHRRHVRHRPQVAHAVVRGVLLQHRRLVVGCRVAQGEADHEAVELRLRQRIGPLVIARVLRRHDDERARQLVRMAVDRHAALLHALEQAGLGLGRGPVDLVDEHDVREDRARVELEARLALVEDVGADHVGGQQVRGALDPGVLGLERARERPGQGRLADAGIVLDQHVPLGEKSDEQLAKDAVGDLHRALDVLPQGSARLSHPRRIKLGHRSHRTMVGSGAPRRGRARGEQAG